MKKEPIVEVPLNVYLDLVEQQVTEGARRNVAMSHITRNVKRNLFLEEQRDNAVGRYQRLRDSLEDAGYEFLLDQFDDLEECY